MQPQLIAVYEDNFNEAIQQLLQWGGVFIGEDAKYISLLLYTKARAYLFVTSGKRHIANKSTKMDWSCTTKVKARDAWKQWRNQFFGIYSEILILSWPCLLTVNLGMVLSIVTFVAARQRRARSAVESRRAATLVQTTLESLRNQELAHHTDPVTAPHPFLSSLQLRDLILQDEHSVSTRRRLWERVERVVEANANVRTNLEEMEGGDEMRVWRWVGSAGKTLTAGSERRVVLSAGNGQQQAEA